MDELVKMVERLTQRVNKSEERLRQGEENLKTLTQYIHSKFKDKDKSNEPISEPEPTIKREFSDPQLISHSIVRPLVPEPDKDLQNRNTVAPDKDMVESHEVTQFKSEIPESADSESLNQLRTFLIQNNLPFSCSICANSFSSEILLTQHHQISHLQCYVQINELSQFSETVTNQNNHKENLYEDEEPSNISQNFTTEIEPQIHSIISISSNSSRLSDTEEICDDSNFEPILNDNYLKCEIIVESNGVLSGTQNIATEKTHVKKSIKKTAKRLKRKRNNHLLIEEESLNLRRADRKRKMLEDLRILDNEPDDDLTINFDSEYIPQKDSQNKSLENEAEKIDVINSPEKSRKRSKLKLSKKTKEVEKSTENGENSSVISKKSRCKKNQLTFPCKICGKVYSSMPHVVRHKKFFHSPVMDHYFCPYEDCEKMYSSSDALMEHFYSLHKHKINSCSKCPLIFTRLITLRHHEKDWHFRLS